MPHCIVEYSANVTQPVDWNTFFKRAYEIIIAQSDVRPETIKSRARKSEGCFVGNGDPKNAFVYLELALMSGRPLEMRQRLGNALGELLKETFAPSRAELNCSVTVEIREMDRESHVRVG